MSTSSRSGGPGDRAREPAPADAGTGTMAGAEAGAEVEDPYGFPRGVRGVGGYFPDPQRGGLLPGGRRAPLLVEGRLAALNRDYPAWRITWFRCSDGSPGGWWAMRRAPLTTAQRDAGLLPCIARGDLVSLISEVTVQNDITERLASAPDTAPVTSDHRPTEELDRPTRADNENREKKG